MKTFLSTLFITGLLATSNVAAAQDKLEVTANIILGGNFQETPDPALLPSDINFDRTPSFGGGIDIRYFKESGHGLVVRGDATGSTFAEGYNLFTGTAAYGHRIQLNQRTARVEKNFDVLAGVRGGYARGTDEFLGGFCLFGCGAAGNREAAIDRMSGGVLGPVVGADFGWDIKRLTMGVGASYSPLFTFAETQANVIHSLEGRFRIGMNFDL